MVHYPFNTVFTLCGRKTSDVLVVTINRSRVNCVGCRTSLEEKGDHLTRAEQIAEREMLQAGQPVVNEDGS